MKILIGTLVLVVWCTHHIIATTVAVPSCPCPKILSPVCGSDNVTYANECIFNCTRDYYKKNCRKPIFLDYQGKCRESCVCTQEYAPVCGSDNQTYSNLCNLICKNKELRSDCQTQITVAYNGTCIAPCVCTREYKPVCGSDGKTYGNKCMFDCENKKRTANGQTLLQRKDGECRKPCKCPFYFVYQPVCGSDGKTYASACELECENLARNRSCQPLLTISSEGECPTSCFCPATYQPVCGSDGNTYPSLCNLGCINRVRKSSNQIKRQYDGECTECICPAVYDPVCASDGKIYPNECELGCESDRRVRSGQQALEQVPEEVCQVIEFCPLIYSPVCGSDNVTYSNDCFLNIASQENIRLGRPSISVKSQGECTDEGCFCLFIYDPVCGNDGNTYSSNCTVACLNEERFKNKQDPIVVVSDGECPCICPLIYLPVCGTDGMTYPNECSLNCTIEENKRNNRTEIRKARDGKCPNPEICFCIDIYKPVCGSDGITYPNDCILRCENAEYENTKRQVKVSHKGECRKPCV